MELQTDTFLSALAKDMGKCQSSGWNVDMLVLNASFEEAIVRAFHGQHYPAQVFDLRPDKNKKVHLYLHNAQVMFTDKVVNGRFFYLLSPKKEATNEH